MSIQQAYNKYKYVCELVDSVHVAEEKLNRNFLEVFFLHLSLYLSSFVVHNFHFVAIKGWFLSLFNELFSEACMDSASAVIIC